MLSTLLSALAFAAFAAASLTTSIWEPLHTFSDWPSTITTLTPGFYASVINVNNDRTTLAMRFDNATDPSATLRDPNDPYTMTVGPSYYALTFELEEGLHFVGGGKLTASVECTSSSKDAAIACTYITNGPEVFSSICSRGTYTGPAPIVTKSSIQYISGLPPFCITDTTVPIEYLATTSIVGESELTTRSYKAVITAGEEKISATTGATPTNTGPPATGTAATGSGTGAAGPMKTSAPLLAGLGAAMAVFVL
jgi:hypothetical protein